jgi:uncharacterized membrane protein
MARFVSRTGMAIGLSHGHLVIGALSGLIGSVVGTVAGSKARAFAAHLFGRDLFTALLEDVLAVLWPSWRFAKAMKLCVAY